MELFSILPKKHLVKNLLIATVVLFASNATSAKPHPPGGIVFIGLTSDQQSSVWLSITPDGMFEVQARNQTVDQWTQPQPGAHITFSPIVSNGNGDPHSLFQIINGDLVFIDKDNQQGGISLPPLPGGLPPGEVTPPIALPPDYPAHPIVIPPGTPPEPGVPTHPIVIPGVPAHPIVIPGEPTPPITQPPAAVSPVTSLKVSKGGGGFINTAPITAGRQFAKQPLWNLWVDGRYFDIKDYRFMLDRTGNASNLTMGADRRVNSDLIIGAQLIHNAAQSTSFNDSWKTNTKGFTLGPYFGYRFPSKWAAEGTLGYGRLENNNNIVILKSKYTTQAYSASLVARKIYNAASIQLQPKPAIYYTYFCNPNYNMNATVNGNVFSVPIASNNVSFGYAQLALEASKPILSGNGNITTVPYVELGLNYAFARPNGGRILGGNLRMHPTSPWAGLARLGVRTLVTKSFFIEATASYLSLGQPHLQVWQGKLYMSWGIN